MRKMTEFRQSKSMFSLRFNGSIFKCDLLVDLNLRMSNANFKSNYSYLFPPVLLMVTIWLLFIIF